MSFTAQDYREAAVRNFKQGRPETANMLRCAAAVIERCSTRVAAQSPCDDETEEEFENQRAYEAGQDAERAAILAILTS